MRWYFCHGAGLEISASGRRLAKDSAIALAAEARQLEKAARAESKKNWDSRRSHEELSREAAAWVRPKFVRGTLPADSLSRLRLETSFAAEAIQRIVTLVAGQDADDEAVELLTRMSNYLASRWKLGRRRGPSADRNYFQEGSIARLLQDLVMRLDAVRAAAVLAPIVAQVEANPDDAGGFLDGLTAAEDRRRNSATYWELWTRFATAAKNARWANHLTGEHPWGRQVISALFLVIPWKSETRHWPTLEGYSTRIDELFDELPNVHLVFDGYVRFLYHVGERQLPASFERLSRVVAFDGSSSLVDHNTIFMLEVLLQRHVYGRPAELKSNENLRIAVLALLDFLVENGSSAAFQMRDDFVTPLT